MRRTRMLSALAAVALATVGVGAVGGSASAAPGSSTVVVQGTANGLTVLHGPVRAGLVRFIVNTTVGEGGSDVSMFAPANGATKEKVLADLAEDFSQDLPTAAKGTRDLVHDATFYGVASAVKGAPVIVSERLTAGTYYLTDLNPAFNGQTPKLIPLQVTGPGGEQTPIAKDSLLHTTVQLTSADTFISRDTLPRAGIITASNVADTIHFMELAPVKPGTTDAQIQAAFDGPPTDGPPPFFIDGPSINSDVLSPGRHSDILYSLPAGTYVLLCFIADDMSGLPHAIMGMHKVVTLR